MIDRTHESLDPEPYFAIYKSHFSVN